MSPAIRPVRRSAPGSRTTSRVDAATAGRGRATRPGGGVVAQWLTPGVSDKAPALSVGLAVRNARDVLERCIESVLSQDFTDLELVICDNVSDDGTITMLENYARSDPRIVLSVNEVNIGSHGNMPPGA